MSNLNDFIYSSVETEIEEISSEKERILTFLKNNTENPTTAHKICKELNLKSSKTEVGLRKSITELIEVHNLPIISTAKGFMYTEDTNKIEKYIENLNSRIKGILRRREALIKTIVQIQESKSLYTIREREQK